MRTSGTCNCTDWKYEVEYDGNPPEITICHCIPCQKTAGLNGSTNIVVPDDKFTKLSGTTKQWTRKGISGGNVTYSFCDTCGTIMTVAAEALPGLTIVKVGSFDDKAVISQLKAGGEIFTKDRADFCGAFQGVEQKEIA